MRHRVWVEIDLKALVANYRKIAVRMRPAKVLCVLKANAYGLGVAAYAKALAAAGCTDFGVAEPHEALALTALFRRAGRRGGPSVQILSSVLPDEIPAMVRAGVVLPVTDLETAQAISRAATRAKTVARVHFKLDTGMGRLGILATGPDGVANALRTMRAVKALPRLKNCIQSSDTTAILSKRSATLSVITIHTVRVIQCRIRFLLRLTFL